MKIIHIDQRSQQWFMARLGMVTSSRASDVFATLKNGQEAAGRRNYRIQLVLERLTNRQQERDYVSPAMLTGIEREAEALALYEALTGQLVQQVGFLQHDELMAGASLDGYVGNFDGIVEVKSPLPATHLDYLKSGKIPDDYMKQVRHQLWISGAAWCDWMSYHPEFPEPLQSKIVRLAFSAGELAAHELAVRLFLSEVEQELELVQRMAQEREVLA